MLSVAVWEPASGREAKAHRLYRSVTIPTFIAVQDDPAQERRGTNPPQEDRNVMSPSPVSTGRLHPSRDFHLRPIKHVFNMRATGSRRSMES